jgi:hypothetical protein
LPSGTNRSGSNVPRSRVVVFEEVGVDVQLVEQGISDRLVAPFGNPRASHVAAAEVNRDGEVRRPRIDHRIDQRRVGVRQVIRVLTRVPSLVPDLRVAQVRQVGVVELDVPTPRLVERRHLVAVGLRQILEELIQVGVRRDVDALASSAKVHHRGGRNRDLRRPGGHRLKKREVCCLDVLHVPQLAGDRHAGRREVDDALAGVKLRGDAAGDCNALQPLEKVDVKHRPAEFAVGNALQSERFLLLDDGADSVVFEGTQFVFRDFVSLKTLAAHP